MITPSTAPLTAAALAAPDLDMHQALCADAEHAHQSIAALIEILRGCPPGYQITAGLVLGLIVSVKMNLDNVVDGLMLPSYH